MTQTLGSAVLALAHKLTSVYMGTASGGSATTLVDSSFPARYGIVPEDDWFNGGTIHFITGTRTGSEVITDWVKSTKTFTFATGTAISGNRYAVYGPEYPRDILRRKINEALENMPGLPDVDESLTVVADQEKYALPSGVYDVYEIAVENSLSVNGVNPVYYIDHKHWRELDGYIYFDPGFYPDSFTDAGGTIRLWCYTKPAELDADDDAISDYYATEWLVMEAAVAALEWRVMITKGQDPMAIYLLEKYEGKLPKVRAEHVGKLPKLGPKTRLSGY